MAVEATNVAQFAVAAVYLGLAAWLLYLNFPSRINRSLALLFFLRGLSIGLNQMVSLDASDAEYWHSIRTYVFIATTFAILDFLIVYTWRENSPARRGARRFLVGLLVAFEIAHALDHSLFHVLEGAGTRFGTLGTMVALFVPVLALAGVWFGRLARTTSVPAQARFHRLLALGFVAAAIGDAAGSFFVFVSVGWEGFVARAGRDVWTMAARLTLIAAIPIAVAGAAQLAMDALRDGARSRLAWILSITALALLPPFIGALFPASEDLHSYIFFNAIPRSIAPALIAYALIRQVASRIDVFALDLQTSFVIKRGTVGGILIAFFFVVSESTASIFGEFAATQNLDPQIAQLVGIVGAGVLLVFLHPLNRLGEKLSTSVLPHSRPIAELQAADRLRIYREQVELAWADGSITRKERLLLDKLREQLNLSLAETARMESRAARGSFSPG